MLNKQSPHHHYLVFYYKEDFDKMTQNEIEQDITQRLDVYCQIDTQGKMINIITDLSSFCEKNGYNRHHIYSCAHGNRKTAHNYQWCLYQNKHLYLDKKVEQSHTNGKTVKQYDLEGNFIKDWPSARSAAIALGKTSGSHISAVCAGRKKTAYGYIWKKENN